MRFSIVAKGLIKHIYKQLTSTFHGQWKYEPDLRHIHFGNKCLEKLKELHLTEKDAIDVYRHGYASERFKMIKKYNGYEIGIFYMIANDTGRVIITWVWKKDRR